MISYRKDSSSNAFSFQLNPAFIKILQRYSQIEFQQIESFWSEIESLLSLIILIEKFYCIYD